VALNPVRAGGGTRIKAIEAFAHRRPLVSTSVGAEGLDVEHGQHLLIADAPDDFAAACLRLMREPGLAAALAERAHALCRERYALARVAERIRDLYHAFASTGRPE
jgi:glycosyltransferase involved in cell wall biosynthesis